MNKKNFSLPSTVDGLPLAAVLMTPEGTPKGIVQFSHGMAEHKERYFPFMEYLTKQGFITVIHDHRGHGASVRNPEDLGYFYTKRPIDIGEDLFSLNTYVRKEYPGLPVFLFSHSMGTLVARVFLQTHDTAVDKVVLCGPPTRNPFASLGLLFVRFNALFFGMHHRSPMIDNLTFGSFTKKGEHKKAWVCSDPQVLKRYSTDELCGYVFTNNGFLNLYRLMVQSFHAPSWNMGHPSLPLFLIAGEEDPVIQNKEKFAELVTFLKSIGYENVTSRTYPGLRHELLNEIGKETIWKDILDFYEA